MRPAQQALLLNADYAPIGVIAWERAVGLLLKKRAEIVVEYARSLLHSVGASMPWPAVVRLKRFVSARARLRFNRANVLARDGYECQFCGARPQRGDGSPDVRDLTLDHVVPRAHARTGPDGPVVSVNGHLVPVTCWVNVVTACAACNGRKANRTPSQAGMRLRSTPRAPTPADVLRMSLRRHVVPVEWLDYLPEGAREWGGYWTAELDPG